MSKKWIELQQKKYAGKNFGETNNVVTRDLEAWKALVEVAKPGMSFLDIGCNNGRICVEMKRRGLTEFGVDLPQVINHPQSLDFHKHALDLEVEFPPGTYDLILCREVIEHIQRYKEVFKLIFAALNEGGTAIITAPHDKKDFGKNCPEHVRLFDEKQLREHIEQEGGKIIKTFKETVCRSIGCVCEKA